MWVNYLPINYLLWLCFLFSILYTIRKSVLNRKPRVTVKEILVAFAANTWLFLVLQIYILLETLFIYDKFKRAHMIDA